ncbi:MAG: helix-turn-helix domain-containing protein [Rhodanobacter sp.]
MNNTIKLLDNYKKVCSIASDNACAVSLGITRSTVSGWRLGKSHPDATSVEKMCAVIGEPLRAWLPLIEAERARTPGDRKVWLRLAQAAATIAGVYLMTRQGIDAHSASAFALSPLYIMRNLRCSLSSPSRHVVRREVPVRRGKS